MNRKVARILGLGGLPGREGLSAAPKNQLEAAPGGREWMGYILKQRKNPQINSPGKPALSSCGFIEGLGSPPGP